MTVRSLAFITCILVYSKLLYTTKQKSQLSSLFQCIYVLRLSFCKSEKYFILQARAKIIFNKPQHNKTSSVYMCKTLVEFLNHLSCKATRTIKYHNWRREQYYMRTKATLYNFILLCICAQQTITSTYLNSKRRKSRLCSNSNNSNETSYSGISNTNCLRSRLFQN